MLLLGNRETEICMHSERKIEMELTSSCKPTRKQTDYLYMILELSNGRCLYPHNSLPRINYIILVIERLYQRYVLASIIGCSNHVPTNLVAE